MPIDSKNLIEQMPEKSVFDDLEEDLDKEEKSMIQVHAPSENPYLKVESQKIVPKEEPLP
jgi:hypothetical protein